MKKTFLEKKRMLLSMLTLVAFLFVGVSGVAAQADVEALQERVAQINQDVETLSDGDVKKTYYTDLVTYYNAVIDDVEQNSLPYIRAVRTNISLMPLGSNGKIISSHLPVSNRVTE